MEIYSQASELPSEWDDICQGNYALQQEFLVFMEKANPYPKQYYVFRSRDGRIDSVFMTFKKPKHNIAMLAKGSLYVDITFIYVPLSVANAGIVLGRETGPEVEKAIRSIKGCKVMLNLKRKDLFGSFAVGRTCSNILLDIRWTSFTQYLDSQRSGYRHRCVKALRRSAELEFSLLEDNRLFDDRMYGLYEQIFNHSRIQVEKLDKAFFQNGGSRIITARKDGWPVAFIQLIENGEELVFAFIGLDYRYNKQHDLYMAMLLKMVEYAIMNGFRRIDLGQTADEAKLKLGGRYEHLYAYLHHSNPLLNLLLKAGVGRLAFKPVAEKFNVFK